MASSCKSSDGKEEGTVFKVPGYFYDNQCVRIKTQVTVDEGNLVKVDMFLYYTRLWGKLTFVCYDKLIGVSLHTEHLT